MIEILKNAVSKKLNPGTVRRSVVAAAVVLLASACEAPLNLDWVAVESAKPVRRYDMFQAAAAAGDRVVVVSSVGAALVSTGLLWLVLRRRDLV